jgi:prophage regulatory protein
MTDKILRLPAVKEMTGLSRSSVYGKIGTGDFPKPISLGARAVGWLESEIDGWIERKVAAARPPKEPALANSPTCTPIQERRWAQLINGLRTSSMPEI